MATDTGAGEETGPCAEASSETGTFQGMEAAGAGEKATQGGFRGDACVEKQTRPGPEAVETDPGNGKLTAGTVAGAVAGAIAGAGAGAYAAANDGFG